MSEREVLARAAAIAADYVGSLGTRPVGPARTYREMLAGLDEPLPEGPSDPVGVVEELARVADDGHHGDGLRAVLRLRDRRSAPGVAGGRLARLGLGPERVSRRADAGGGRARGGRGTLGARAARASLAFVVRVRDRVPDGARDVPRRRAPFGLRAAPAGTCPSRDWRELRRSGSSSATSATSRSRARSASSGSAGRRRSSSRPTARVASSSPSLPRRSTRRSRRSSAPRPAR